MQQLPELRELDEHIPHIMFFFLLLILSPHLIDDYIFTVIYIA